jgi:hypothetical protein
MGMVGGERTAWRAYRAGKRRTTVRGFRNRASGCNTAGAADWSSSSAPPICSAPGWHGVDSGLCCQPRLRLWPRCLTASRTRCVGWSGSVALRNWPICGASGPAKTHVWETPGAAVVETWRGTGDAEGEGTILRRANGRWAAAIVVGGYPE